MHLFVLLAALLNIFSNAKAQSDPAKYTVALYFEDMGYRCAAAIVEDKFLITSGECFASKMNEYIDVAFINAVANGTKGIVEVKVEAVYLPYFYAGRFRTVHDFAVVKLKRSLNLRENGFVALNLPASNNDDDQYKGVVGSVSKPGREVTEKVKVVESKECAAQAFKRLMSDSQFCTKLQDSSRKCSGDRGSPIVEGDDLLIGVDLACKKELSYELFAKVSNFRDMVDSVIAGTPGLYSKHYYP